MGPTSGVEEWWSTFTRARYDGYPRYDSPSWLTMIPPEILAVGRSCQSLPRFEPLSSSSSPPALLAVRLGRSAPMMCALHSHAGTRRATTGLTSTLSASTGAACTPGAPRTRTTTSSGRTGTAFPRRARLQCVKALSKALRPLACPHILSRIHNSFHVSLRALLLLLPTSGG